LTQEITSGVNEGDTVVTDGIDKLTDGMKVVIAKPDDQGATDSSTAGSSSDQPAGQQHHKKKPQSGDTNAAPAS